MPRLIVCLSAVLWMTASSAADKPAYGPAPDWVRPSTPDLNSKSESEAAVRLLLLDQQMNFSASGDEAYFHNALRIQSPQGLSAAGTLRVQWKPDTDELTIHKLNILRGGETIDILTSGESFTVLRRENNLEYSALDGILTAAIQPAGLRVGDVLEMAFTRKRKDPLLAGAAQAVMGGSAQLSVAQLRLRARWPSSQPIKWRSSASLGELKKTQVDNFTEVSFSADNVEPLKQPVDAPVRFRKGREIEFSALKSWSDISSRFAPLYADAGKLDSKSPLHKEAARIRESAATPKDRASAALALVQDQVRYVFLGMNDGGLVPASADLTWTRRFGDCKAKTVLLLALLRELDIAAEPVLVSTALGDGLDARLPLVGLFDHVIVRTNIGGKTYWLDGTRMGDRRLDALDVPTYRFGLPLTKQGSELIAIPITPPTEPLLVLNVRIDSKEGLKTPAPIHAEAVFSGDAAVLTRNQLGALTSADREQFLRNFWKEHFDYVEVQSVSSKFDEQASHEYFVLDGTAKLDWTGNMLLLDEMRLGTTADLKRPDGADNEPPFAVAFPFYVRSKHVIELPNKGIDFKVDGADFKSEIAGMEYTRTAKIEGHVFTGETSVRSVKTEFPSADAPAAHEQLSAMYKNNLNLVAPKNYKLTEKEMELELAKTLTTSRDYADRGLKLLDSRKFEQAIKDFDKAIELNSKSDYALANRGFAHLGAQRMDLARRDFDAAVALNPRNAVALRGRGRLALSNKQYTDAIELFTKSLAIDQNNSFALENRAFAYLLSGQDDKALAATAEAIKNRSSAEEMYLYRASLFDKRKQLDNSKAEISALLAANPDSASAHKSAGTYYATHKMDSEASKEFDRAVALLPNEDNYITRARYRPSTDTLGMHADLDAALKLNGKSRQALVMKAQLHREAKEFSESIALYGKALEGNEKDWMNLTSRGVVYALNGDDALATADFAAARAVAKSAVELNDICWNIATQNVALKTALSICDEAVAKAPGNARLIDSRGFVILRLGRYDEAIAVYNSALELSPYFAPSLYGRGIAKLRKGDVAGSEADLKAARESRPEIDKQFAGYGVQP